MNRKILEIILSGLSDKNIRFNDLRKLVFSLGFAERIKGSHHIFTKSGVIEIINLQPLDDGKAKPYQIKQVRNLILKYKIHEEVLRNGQI
ncbi:MAG: type II toxin-antitoxin system HicA family toxin [Elusimicrobia bacterium]|nr:type II toxin-antitoxin system HicA family toxin [Elusimicrobiota bacterium]